MTVSTILDAVSFIGMPPEDLQVILDDWIDDREFAVPDKVKRLPQPDQIAHLIEIGVPPERLVRAVEDYYVP